MAHYFDELSIPKIAEDFASNTWMRCTLNPETMWYWDKIGHVWRPDAESYMVAWIGENCPNLTRKQFIELKFAIQKHTIITHDNFRANGDYIQFQNKELNLKTLVDEGTINIEHYIKTRLDTELDLKAEPPFIFLQCLRNILPDGQELFRCLQAFSSILLVKSMRIDKAFFFLGSGGNGKSTIMKAVENVFENFISHVDLADLVNDPFAVSQLVGKLANVYADIQSLKFKDLKIFKTISTGDIISINEKYKARRDECVKVVQFYSANKMPEIENANDGFYRRVFPIIFDQKIVNPDPYIDDKLNTPDERKKILALLIKIAIATKRHGFLFEKSQEDIINIINEKGDPIRQMLGDADYILVRPEYRIDHAKLFGIYYNYCKAHNFSPKTQGAFTRFMHDENFESLKSNGVKIFIGVGLPSKGVGQKVL